METTDERAHKSIFVRAKSGGNDRKSPKKHQNSSCLSRRNVRDQGETRPRCRWQRKRPGRVCSAKEQCNRQGAMRLCDLALPSRPNGSRLWQSWRTRRSKQKAGFMPAFALFIPYTADDPCAFPRWPADDRNSSDCWRRSA